MATLDPKDLLETLDLKDHPGAMVLQDLLVETVKLVPVVLVQPEKTVQLEGMAHQEPPVPLDLREEMVRKEGKVGTDRTGRQERQVPLELLVKTGKMARTEKMARMQSPPRRRRIPHP